MTCQVGYYNKEVKGVEECRDDGTEVNVTCLGIRPWKRPTEEDPSRVICLTEQWDGT